MLELRGVQHEVLNAKHHQKEAEIVAQAGHFGAVTIATNMAGRGTDILLGGNPDYLARRQMRQDEVLPELIEEATGHNENVSQEVLDARARYNELFQKFKKTTDTEHDRVVSVGGLHIVGTERHESRRIDNQLRGRSGRQGDPGSTQFFISLEDDVMRLFGSERIAPLVERLGMNDEQPMEAGLLTKQIESAQKRIEGRNFDIRKHVLQFDDVMNQQREVIYGQRRDVLNGANMQDYIQKLIKDLIHSVVARHCTGENGMDWDMESAAEYLERLCVKKGTIAARRKEIEGWEVEEFQKFLEKQAEEFYAERETMLSEMGIDMREFERVVLLSAVDARWMDHIDAMDHLRDGIGLRAYGQKDPVTEYKLESFEMFEEMVRLIREDTVTRLYQARVQKAPERHTVATPIQETGADANALQQRTLPEGGKISRNALCPCGSGKKYKHCHGKDEQ
jgi:preprotein translocase subunit SecA